MSSRKAPTGRIWGWYVIVDHGKRDRRRLQRSQVIEYDPVYVRVRRRSGD